jgi:hypothetical protein
MAMPFSEKIKLEAKRKAAFQCCICRQVVVGSEVHHITPEEYGGLSDLDNAALLCPNCHTAYGNDPEKRKEIRHRRDWWYEQVEKMYPPQGFGPGIFQKLEEITKNLDGLSSLEEIKTLFKDLSNEAIDKVTPANANATASTLINTLVPTTSGGSPYGLLISSGQEVLECPRCRWIITQQTTICPGCGMRDPAFHRD